MMPDLSFRKLKPLPVYVWSLGCPKNRADSEHVLGSLPCQVQTVSSPAAAKLVFINTCAFIEPAVRESLQAIFEMARKLKRLKRKPLLVVAGCLPGRYGMEELRREIKEVDLWLHPSAQDAWPTEIAAALELTAANKKDRLFSTPSQLWLKIAEGCQHKCAFCTIPAIRGKLRSVPVEELAAEVRKAAELGIKEIDLVAQDVCAWGKDFANSSGAAKLADLLRVLAEIPGIAWLRLFYLYPAEIDDELLRTIAQGLPILPYLDIPLQHSESGILENMGRPFKIDPRKLLQRIRHYLPNAALRSTLMVGYPGETEKDFANLCQFVKDARFNNLGVFAFQPEEGTKAASLPGQLPPEVKEERRNILMDLQANISREILSEYVGRQMDVLVDSDCSEQWPGLHAGRVWFQAPEVDGVTYISGKGVVPGAMLTAEIVDAQTYDLSALADCAR